MSRTLKIDVVSDIVCPWCAVGLSALLRAIDEVGGDLAYVLRFQPFELNPDLPREGEDIAAHLSRKYGLTEGQLRENTRGLVARAAELDVTIDPQRRTRIYNTFDAHRLLAWAGAQGEAAQFALKQALLRAYHGEGRDIADGEVLAAIAGEAGLEAKDAARVLETDAFADEVRAQERFYRELGITAVPSVIFDDRHLVQGGQPVATFVQALRQLSDIAA